MNFNYDLFINKFKEQEVSACFLSKVSGVNKSTIHKLMNKDSVDIGIKTLRSLEKALLIEKGGLLL